MAPMKRTATTSTTITAILGLIAVMLIILLPAPRPAGARSTNPPTKTTGAPGENTCIQCHNDFSENDGVGSITLTGLPASYTPGNTYTLGISEARTGSTVWGFETTALNSGGTAAGTLTDTNVYVGKQIASSKQYIGQTTSKGSDGTFAGQADAAAWTFSWTAPSAGAGTVTFYFAGIAGDNLGDTAGDYAYISSVSSTEGPTTDVEATTWGKIKLRYR